VKILLWHVHGAWTTAFVHGRHEYVVPVTPDRGPDGRGRAQTYAWPETVRELSPEALREEDFDAVVLQRPHELDGLAEQWLGGRRPGRDLPALYVEHNAPQGRIAELRHPAADREDVTLVHVTHFNALFWDAGATPTRVVEHGIVDPGERYTGELDRTAVVINEARRRARVTGTDLLERFREASPIDVFGMDAASVGGIEDLPQDELHTRWRAAGSTCTRSAGRRSGLSLLEAMHLGMPVVALGTTEAFEAVPPEAGVVSTDVDRLTEAVRRLVADPEEARERGAAARDVALARYGTGPVPVGLGRRARGGGPMRIAMVSEHASPLAVLGGVDAGGQNVHVAELARALARRGAEVVVHTRRDDPGLPRRVRLAPGVVVDHVDAGPACELPKDDLLPFMDAFAEDLQERWAEARPDVVHSHFWMSGLAALDAAQPLGIPVAHTFHALGTVKRRHQGDRDTSPAGRIGIERRIARRADRIVATCSDEVFELLRLRADRRRVTVVPCGVDRGTFTPDGPAEPREPGGPARLVMATRLVERKGVADAVRALPALPGAELHVAGAARRPAARRRPRGAAAVRAGRGARRRGPPRAAGARRPRGAPRAAALGRRRALHAVVRAVRHRAARGDGLRRARSSRRRSAARSTPWSTRSPGCTSRRATRPPWPRGRPSARGPARREALGRAGCTASAALQLGPGRGRHPRGLRRAGRVGVVAGRAASRGGAGLMSRFERPLPAGRAHLAQLGAPLRALETDSPRVEAWGRRMADVLIRGGRVLAAGNGGSAVQAQHLTSELVGRYRDDRPPLSAIPLCVESGALTAIGNDYGFDEIFARQLRAHARPGDLFVGLSTSGRSANVLAAAEDAARMGLESLALTGPAPNPLCDACDDTIVIDSPHTATVQELHLIVVHMLCAAVDVRLDELDVRRAEGALS
jgi:type III pantothenate kinase